MPFGLAPYSSSDMDVYLKRLESLGARDPQPTGMSDLDALVRARLSRILSQPSEAAPVYAPPPPAAPPHGGGPLGPIRSKRGLQSIAGGLQAATHVRGILPGLIAGFGGGLASGGAYDQAQAKLRLDQEEAARKAFEADRRAYEASQGHQGTDLNTMLDYLKPTGKSGTSPADTGVAPLGTMGPLPPGQIHAEELPPGIAPVDYPTYRKSRAEAAGRRAGAPLATPKASVHDKIIAGLMKTRGWDSATAEDALASGIVKWKLVKAGSTTKIVDTDTGQDITTVNAYNTAQPPAPKTPPTGKGIGRFVKSGQ